MRLSPLCEASPQDDAETGPQTYPNGVARESEEDGADSGSEDKAYASRNRLSGLSVLRVNHAEKSTDLRGGGAADG